MKRVLSMLLALALLAGNLPAAAFAAEIAEVIPTGSAVQEAASGEADPTIPQDPAVTEPAPTVADPAPTVADPAPTVAAPTPTVADVTEPAPTEPEPTEPEPTEAPVLLTGELTDRRDGFQTSAPAISTFALDSSGRPALAGGNHVKWIDRLAELPDYATSFYSWLIENTDGDGSNDAMISPSGEYLLTTIDYEDLLPISADATQAEAYAAFDELVYQNLNEVSNYIQAVYNAFDRDHPEVFWLSGEQETSCAYSYYTPWQTSQGWMASFSMEVYFTLSASGFDVRNPSYLNSSSIYSAISTRDANVSSILSGIPSGASTYDKLAYLNDWLTQHNCYNTTYPLENLPRNSYECVSALAGSVGTSGPVCEAYARAFMVLCNRLGIPCVLVDGAADNGDDWPEAHMWNYVQVDGKWYAVDVTWNDPSVSGVSGAVSGYESRDYLLVGRNTVVDGYKAFLITHPVSNMVSSDGVSFTNGPVLYSHAYEPPAEVLIAIDETNFPDTNFRTYISKNCDTDKDGSLSAEECAAVKKLYIGGKVIYDLTGIQYFTDLIGLYCHDNYLTTLDISHNTALQELTCRDNQFTTLDVSNNTALTKLSCYNTGLTSLDISKNTNLLELSCQQNRLTSLDVSNNTALQTLNCEENRLTSLDVSHNPDLKYLYCDQNKLTTLDVSDHTALQMLYCYYNQLTTLDVSGCTALESLHCYVNQLTSLDVSNCTALKDVYCYDNQLTTMDLSDCIGLKYLHCYDNQLAALDTSACTALQTLKCGTNQLSSLDVSDNTALGNLDCADNRHPIEVTGNTFDLSALPGFDVSKASAWSGGSVSGTALTVEDGAESVSYTYDCGNGYSETFTLDVTYVEGSCEHSYSWVGEWNEDYTACTVTITCIDCWESWDIVVTDITKEVLAESTATIKGRIKYTAVATFGGRDFVCTATVEQPVLEMPLPVSGTMSNGIQWSIDENGHMIISGTGEMPWCDTEMGAPWNAYFDLIKSAEISEGITSVGPYTFYKCLYMTEVTLPSTLKAISKYAFHWCRNLTTLDLPDGLEEIGDQAFYNCDGLETIDFGKSLRSVGYMGFNQCRALTEITFPATLESLGNEAFGSCNELRKVTFLGEKPDFTGNVFSSMYTIQFVYAYPTGSCGSNVTWTLDLAAKTLTISGSGAMADYSSFAYSPFQNYKDDIEKIVIVNGVTSIGDCAFGGLTALKEVTIPASVTGIGKGAFEVCTALSSISLPESLLSIGSNAFQGCTALKSVTIPKNVTVADRVFQNCTGLTSATISAGTQQTLGGGAYLFAGCTGLTSVTIEEGVEFLPQYAFSGCTKLASITIPGSVEVLAGNVFDGCTSLSSVTMETGVEVLGPYLFQNCTSLREITLPGGVTMLEEGVFQNCTKLDTITFQGAAPEFSSAAFSTLSGVTIRYPQNDASWNGVTNKDYGASTTTWTSYANGHTHSYGPWTETTPATCTTEGSKESACSCGLSMVMTIPALEHDFDAGTITIYPEVDAWGEMTYTCSRCNESYTDPIDPTGTVTWVSDYEFQFTTFEDLKAMVQRSYEDYVYATYVGTGPLVISEDFTLNEMIDLCVYKNTLQIPKNVTFTMPYPCILYADNLDVDGELYINSADVYMSADISGTLYISNMLWMPSDATLIGEKNISYTTEEAILRICYWVYTTEDMKTAIAAFTANTDNRKDIVLSLQGDLTLTESITIPAGCSVYTDGTSITIASNATLTVEDFLTLTVPMTVYGSLVNDYAIDVYSDDPYTGSITFANGSRYSGTGELYVTSSLLTGPETALSGLDLERFEISENSNTYEHWWTLVLIQPCTEHTWDAGTVTKEPTASEPGVKTYTCTGCGETKTEEIPATGEETVTPGDVNEDGKVNSRDVLAILQFRAGKENVTINETAADVNQDGKINSRDILAILQLRAGK